MSKNSGIRITIDGQCNIGKTLIAWKIAEFLKLCGVEDTNISFFNDNMMEMPDPVAVEKMLNSALSGGMWKDMEFAFVERNVPRLFLVDGGVEGSSDWRAKPEKYVPTFQGPTHIQMEMGRSSQPTIRAAQSMLVMLKFAGVLAAIKNALPQGITVPTEVEEWLSQAGVFREADPMDLDATGVIVEPLVIKLNSEESEGFEASMLHPAPAPEALKDAMERMRARRGTENASSASSLQQPKRFWQAGSVGALLLNSDDPIQELTNSLSRRGYRDLFEENLITSFDTIDRKRAGQYYDHAREQIEPNNPYQPMMAVQMSRKDRGFVAKQDYETLRQALYHFDPLILVTCKLQNSGISDAHVSADNRNNTTDEHTFGLDYKVHYMTTEEAARSVSEDGIMTRTLSDSQRVFQGRSEAKQVMFGKMARYVAPPSTLQEPTQFWETSRAAQLLKAGYPEVALRDAMVPYGIVHLWRDHWVSIQLIERAESGDWYDEWRAKSDLDNAYQCWVDVCIGRKDGESVTEENYELLKKACRDFDPLITVARKVKNSSISGAHVSVSTPLFNPAAYSKLAEVGRQAMLDVPIADIVQTDLESLRSIAVNGPNKLDPLFRFGGINKVMADPELRKQAIAYLQSKHPYDTEYVDPHFGGAVLGTPGKPYNALHFKHTTGGKRVWPTLPESVLEDIERNGFSEVSGPLETFEFKTTDGGHTWQGQQTIAELFPNGVTPPVASPIDPQFKADAEAAGLTKVWEPGAVIPGLPHDE